MTPAHLFDRASRALFGPRYKQPMAEALKLRRADTIDDWASGRSEIPAGVWLEIAALVQDRREQLPEIHAAVLQQADPPSAPGFQTQVTSGPKPR
jgi:hypothetical protein